jgi:hypothetical protein
MHVRTHRPISNSTYCFSTAKIIRERVLVLRYTYIACLVYILKDDIISGEKARAPVVGNQNMRSSLLADDRTTGSRDNGL